MSYGNHNTVRLNNSSGIKFDNGQQKCASHRCGMKSNDLELEKQEYFGYENSVGPMSHENLSSDKNEESSAKYESDLSSNRQIKRLRIISREVENFGRHDDTGEYKSPVRDLHSGIYMSEINGKLEDNIDQDVSPGSSVSGKYIKLEETVDMHSDDPKNAIIPLGNLYSSYNQNNASPNNNNHQN